MFTEVPACCELHAVNFFLLQSFIQVFTLAFVVVGATCAVMIPIMLHMLQLQQFGWNWIHACMFGAMIASTDAVAIVSIMKTSECHLQQPGSNSLGQAVTFGCLIARCRETDGNQLVENNRYMHLMQRLALHRATNLAAAHPARLRCALRLLERNPGLAYLPAHLAGCCGLLLLLLQVVARSGCV
jgi:hypothetical protein